MTRMKRRKKKKKTGAGKKTTYPAALEVKPFMNRHGALVHKDVLHDDKVLGEVIQADGMQAQEANQ